jgi:hypothetical protein
MCYCLLKWGSIYKSGNIEVAEAVFWRAVYQLTAGVGSLLLAGQCMVCNLA